MGDYQFEEKNIYPCLKATFVCTGLTAAAAVVEAAAATGSGRGTETEASGVTGKLNILNIYL